MSADSLEIRWFVDEPHAFFTSWNDWQPERTDRYAPIVDAKSSVKVRGIAGAENVRIETKQFVATADRFTHWRKITATLTGYESNSMYELADLNWWQVAKRRCIKLFVPAAASIGWRELDSSHSTSTIQAEWTHVQFANRTAWSFCLEAPMCPDDTLHRRAQDVDSLLRYLFGTLIDFPFRDNCRMSYPQWLINTFEAAASKSSR